MNQEEEFTAVLVEEEIRREEYQKQQLLKSQDISNKTQNEPSSTEEDIEIGLPLSPTISRKSLTSPSLNLGDLPVVESSIPNPPQQREYLISLLFENPNRCISSSNQYDPSLSLITEDTADD